ncbi:MAG TPA: hypothetical protein VEF04_00395, partial [Blastocatellia bacterium]|nr:hypothetical protein [Blastocatellia bacterium]
PPSVFDEPPFVDYVPSDPFIPMAQPTPPPSFNRLGDGAAAPAPARTNGHAKVSPGREIPAIRAELEQRRKNLLEAALDEATVSFSNGTLTAIFASDNAFARRLRESTEIFKEIGQKLFGEPIKIRVEINGAAAPSQIDEAKLARERLHAQAMQNPTVKSIIEIFRGEIIEVKELAQQNESSA